MEMLRGIQPWLPSAFPPETVHRIEESFPRVVKDGDGRSETSARPSNGAKGGSLYLKWMNE
jgi:hypothetical protein